jgi:hypothetical protein|tara:strand:+ start:17 stop:226 length:210 start_codon:yes stop_codon:yes gene_type:complete
MNDYDILATFKTNYPLEDMILALRALAENYSDLCGVALQLVPDDQNLPGDILAIWEAIEAQNLEGLVTG